MEDTKEFKQSDFSKVARPRPFTITKHGTGTTMTFEPDNPDQEPLMIYKLEQRENNGYDTFSDCVVCAYNVEDAKSIVPGRDYNKTIEEIYKKKSSRPHASWATKRENVKCTLIGMAVPGMQRGTVCESFHAG